MRQRCLLSSLFIKIVLKVLAEAMRQERETKGIQIGKEEIDIPLFALPSKCQKASRNNKHIQQYARIQNQAVKKISSFSIHLQQTHREEWKALPLTMVTMKMNSPEINLTKKANDLYKEIIKPLKKERYQKVERHLMLMDWEN